MDGLEAMKAKDHSGETWGRLTIIRPLRSIRWDWVYECLCQCGNTTEAYFNNIRRGNTRSCGCIHSENVRNYSRTHGRSKTTLYGTWTRMKQRCENPDAADFSNYGGRGIRVCDRWSSSFELFAEDMGRKPSPKHSLERINNDGNYEPVNVRWATSKEQNRNKRNVRTLEINGVTKTIIEWCEQFGTSYKAAKLRLDRYGFSPLDAVSIRGRRKPAKRSCASRESEAKCKP